ncbi:hypothetical protein D6D02_07917 [Aureobasidium pullulans]|nr:hypothetical protein D6D02_07917 [Aureobasidium pullulans]
MISRTFHQQNPRILPSNVMSDNITEFCQAGGRDQPEYSVYELGPQRFGATCSILGQTHHDQDAAFSSKKLAKTAAARATVFALREEGVLRKPALHTRSAHAVAPAVPAFGTPLPVPSKIGPAAAGTPPVQPSPSPSPAASSLIPALCTALNIAPPTYKLTQTSALTPDFWDGEARFDHAVEPCLRGAVGRVNRVYGKKNAKDQIVEKVLVILQGVKEQRMAG